MRLQKAAPAVNHEVVCLARGRHEWYIWIAKVDTFAASAQYLEIPYKKDN
jgi:hypothetical protein